jgi:hypothetical protein
MQRKHLRPELARCSGDELTDYLSLRHSGLQGHLRAEDIALPSELLHTTFSQCHRGSVQTIDASRSLPSRMPTKAGRRPGTAGRTSAQ